MGSAIRNQSSRPLRAHQLSLAGTCRRGAGRLCLVGRTPSFRHPLGRRSFAHGYDKWLAYGQSKTANALFAVQLDALGRDVGVRAFSVHPGKIFTPLQRHLAKEEMIAAGWLDANGNPSDPTFKTPQQGAATQVWAATSPQLEKHGGVYCEDCDIATLDGGDKPSFTGVRDYAVI